MRSPQPRTATLVLCTPDGDVLGRLPPFETEVPWWQDAECLVRGARQRHGVEVTVLRLLEAALPEPPGGAVTYLAEVPRPPAGTVPLDAWSGGLADHPLRAAYAVPGGPRRALSWAAAVLDRHGAPQTGPAEQVRTWNLSGLWRIPSAGGTVWLKCVPPFFAHEGAVIAGLQGRPVPRLIAHGGGRVLMAEVPGTDQYDADVETQLALVSLLVGLQQEWTSRPEALIGLGMPDWRAEPLSASIASVVERVDPELVDYDRRALWGLVEGLPQRFAAIGHCAIPDSFVHGDFAPGNARGDGSTLTLLDWGDSTVGHPLLDQVAFLDRIPPDVAPRVRKHWDDAWRQAVPGSDPRTASDLLAPVAAARQAVVYQNFLDAIEPSEHPYHRGDPARWLARAAELSRQEAEPRHPPYRRCHRPS